MPIIVQWSLFAIGITVILFTFHSIIQTIVLPRHFVSRVTIFTWLLTSAFFHGLARLRRDYHYRDTILAFLGPTSLLALLMNWILLLLGGFAAAFVPYVNGNITHAILLAGSSFFTLGFAFSLHGGPLILEFSAAASGMIVVALQIGYLPMLYASYNRREALVTALSIRLDEHVSGPELLARHHEQDADCVLPRLFEQWEALAADLVESHMSYPFLIVFRSPHPTNSWPVSLLAVVDAAALWLALTPSTAPAEAKLFFRVGTIAIRRIAQMVVSTSRLSLRSGKLARPPEVDQMDLTFSEFAAGYQRVYSSGFVVETTVESAWETFAALRFAYEAAAKRLIRFYVTEE